MQRINKIIIYSDGGSRGNPGPAAIGVLIQKDKQDNRDNQDNLVEISKCIGTATNNQAEYTAVIEALKWIEKHVSKCHSEQSAFRSEESATNVASHIRERSFKQSFQDDKLEIEFFLDSQLVVEQLNQRYKLKNEGLKPLFWEIQELVMKVGGKVTFSHIPREENKEADKLVNKALDEAK